MALYGRKALPDGDATGTLPLLVGVFPAPPGDWTWVLARDMLNMEGLKLLSLETTPDDDDDEEGGAELAGREGGRGRTNGLGCV